MGGHLNVTKEYKISSKYKSKVFRFLKSHFLSAWKIHSGDQEKRQGNQSSTWRQIELGALASVQAGAMSK